MKTFTGAVASASVFGLGAISLYLWCNRRERKNRKYCKTVEIHNEVVGHLIGEAGVVIQDISVKTGTEIKFFHDEASPDYCVCHIKGSENSTKEALSIIYQILKRFGDGNFLNRSNINIFKEDIDYQNLKEIARELNESSNKPTTNDENVSDIATLKEAVNNIDYVLGHTQKLCSVSEDGYIPVYVSAVANPSLFWVQVTKTKEHIALDKLTEELTEFYRTNPEWDSVISYDEVKVGLICATHYVDDGKWYRAEITDILPLNEKDINETTIDLYFLDYGISSYQKVKNIRKLPSDFLKLKFQAIECGLSHIKPRGDLNSWPAEAITFFEDITHVGQWSVLMARIDFLNDEDRPQLTLIDTKSVNDVNIADSMVRMGFAKYSFT